MSALGHNQKLRISTLPLVGWASWIPPSLTRRRLFSAASGMTEKLKAFTKNSSLTLSLSKDGGVDPWTSPPFDRLRVRKILAQTERFAVLAARVIVFSG